MASKCTNLKASQQNGKTLFVKNLPYEADEREVASLFANVKEVRIGNAYVFFLNWCFFEKN